jgi:PAS domain S-box-containing protein
MASTQGPGHSAVPRRAGAFAFRLFLGGLVLAGLGTRAWALDPGLSIGQYVHDSWTRKDGLPEGAVLALHQTSDGYLWLGLQAGLARFDGQRIAAFQEGSLGLKQHSFGHDFWEAPDGSLFAGLIGGVAEYGGGRFKFYDQAQGLPHPFVYALTSGPGNALWVGTGGTGVWQLRAGSFFRHPAYDANPRLPGQINDLANDAHGRLWVATDDGALALNGGVHRYTKQDGLPSLAVNVVTVDRTGRVWLGTNAGLVHGLPADPEQSIREFTPQKELAGHDVTALFEDSQGTLWIGTREGELARLRGPRLDLAKSGAGAPNGSVFALGEDRDGSLWLGTSDGLERYKNGAFVTVGREQGLANEQIFNVTPRRAGGLWVLDGAGAISIFETGHATAVAPAGTIPGEGMLGFVETDEGSLWVGGRTLHRRRASGQWQTYANTGGEFTVLVAAGPDLIVAQTTGDGASTLSRFDLATERFVPIPVDTNLQHVQRIHRDRAGRLWISTGGGGLVRLDADGIRVFRTSDGLPHDVVYGIAEDARGELWVATRAGLARIRGEVVTNLSGIPGLPRRSPVQVQLDGVDSLWVTADDGVYRIAMRELDAAADGTLATPKVEKFTTADGLRSVEVSWRSSGQALTADGRLWYATARGLASVEPRALAAPRPAPPVFIEALLAGGQPVDLSAPVSLKSGRERLELRFTAPSPTGAEQLRFRYRLVGYDADWNEAGAGRTATYTNAPAGSYTFRVGAKRSGGTFGGPGEEATLRIVIQPRWYETWLARLSALLALLLTICGLTLGFYRLRVRGLQRRDRLLVEKVAERTTALGKEVAERRAAESEVRRLNEGLEDRVRERTTQLETANRDLADQKERLAVTLRSIADGVVTTDLAEKISLMNPVAERHTGWRSDEAVGRPLTEVFRVRDRFTDEPLALPVSQVLVAGGPKASVVSRAVLLARDGAEILFDASAAPIHDSASRVVGAVLVFRDVTEKTRADEQIQKSQKLEAVGILAGGIAHDFNNLLAGIFGHIDLALGTLKPDSPAVPWLKGAAETIEGARALARQLLTFSAGGRPATEPHSLGEVVRRSARFVLSGSNVSAELAMPEDLWSCEIDPGQIRQAIDNLVLNARQAMPDGGHVTIRASNLELRADGATDVPVGRYVELRVSDDGPGIRPEIRPRIFDPFFTTKPTGNGLGLATVHSIITQHGGTIELDASKATGTTFRIRLRAAAATAAPKVVAPAGEPSAPAGEPTRPAGNCRLLVLDDEPSIRRLIQAALREVGYEVLVASEGAEAVALFQAAKREQRPIEIVILDLTIAGGMGGTETLARLRAIDPGLRAIASSGYSTGDVMAEPRAFGFVGTLAKPYTLAELERVVASARRAEAPTNEEEPRT